MSSSHSLDLHQLFNNPNASWSGTASTTYTNEGIVPDTGQIYQINPPWYHTTISSSTTWAAVSKPVHNIIARMRSIADEYEREFDMPMMLPEDQHLALTVARHDPNQIVRWCRAYPDEAVIMTWDGRRFEVLRDDNLETTLTMLFESSGIR